jgi:sulfur-oxidizing protein SoxX
MLRHMAALAMFLAAAKAAAQTQQPPQIVGDGIPAALTDQPGDAEQGRAIVTNRQVGLCVLCHSGPFPDVRFQGNLAPDLTGVGSRYTVAQLRLRIVDPARLKPDTIMPAYLRTEGLIRVAPAFQGKSVLTAQQIEDVVAFLATLRTETVK